jgi:polar amino acid transport system substrate-binding protein
MFSKIFTLPIVLIAFIALNGCSDDKSVVRVATSPFYPPIVYKKDGTLVGIDIEIFKAFCAKISCSPQIKEYDFPVMLQAVSNGAADIAFSGISITEERQTTLDFSQPYFHNAIHLVSIAPDAKKISELSELKKFRIGYPIGNVYDEFIERNLAPEGYYALLQIRHYTDYTQVLKDMQSGNLDLTFMDELSLRLWQKKHGSAVKSVFKFPQQDPWGFAFGKRSTLKNEFDAFLKKLGPEGVQKIIDQAVGNKEPS